jgi:hypothetical protein
MSRLVVLRLRSSIAPPRVLRSESGEGLQADKEALETMLALPTLRRKRQSCLLATTERLVPLRPCNVAARI